ncbi:Ribosomal RNA small subunit methyltransferase A [bioreactor metagenome]|uniref:Ribosomal RNA small subunit methyltransferase A n=1 Tax=bioreactor metagenome TaxID=1076179 RepID=A0A645F8J3_9ZZZZ
MQNEIAVIGNIPYNITNDIVFWLFENSNLIKTAVLTIQKEVAARYTAKPRTKDYGITTLAMQLYGNAKIAFHIPPGAFYPAPKVTSTVIVIDFSDKKKYCEIDKKRVIELIRAAFSKRRKIINNSIKSYLDTKQVNVKKLNEILQEEHKNYMNMRAEELTIEDYICFYEIIKNSVM